MGKSREKRRRKERKAKRREARELFLQEHAAAPGRWVAVEHTGGVNQPLTVEALEEFRDRIVRDSPLVSFSGECENRLNQLGLRWSN